MIDIPITSHKCSKCQELHPRKLKKSYVNKNGYQVDKYTDDKGIDWYSKNICPICASKLRQRGNDKLTEKRGYIATRLKDK